MKLHIGLLSYTCEPKLDTVVALVNSLPALSEAGIAATFSARYGDGILPRVRNSILAEFMSLDGDKLLMLDDDVVWRPQDAVRLVGHAVDVVAGSYPFKNDSGAFPLNWIKERKWLKADPATGLLEVETVPAGFLCVSRACIEAMYQRFKERQYIDGTYTGKQACGLFDFELHPFGYRGEDYTFCHRWRDMGGKVWLDPELHLGHVGLKRFEGSIGNWLRNRPPHEFNGEPEPAKEAAE